MVDELEELEEKFSDIPESIIHKADVLVRGVKRSATLEEVGHWALPQSKFIFHWDREKLQQGDIGEGRIMIPEWFQFKDGTTTCIMLDNRSPYTIERSNGKLVLAFNGRDVAPVSFQPMPEWCSMTDEDGVPLPIYAAQEGADSVCSVILHHCQYFNTGDECRFCNFDHTVDLTKEAGREMKVAKKPEQVAEAYRQAFREMTFAHVRLSGGAHLKRGKEAEIYATFIQAIKDAIGKRRDTLYGEIVSQAFEGEDAANVHDAGIEGVCWNMEQWDQKMFEVICPGKSKAVGRDGWMKILEGALDYWDQGKVTTSFVVGPEMLPPHGFSKMEEGIESWTEGFGTLMDRGIIPRFNMWSPDVGSMFENDVPPPAEYYIEIGRRWDQLMRDYGYYPQPTQVCYLCIHRSIWADFYHLKGA